MDKALLSTGKDDWGTPQELYDALNKEFGFTLDACADENNYKCANYYTAETDGLKMDWGGANRILQPTVQQKDKKQSGAGGLDREML